MPELSRVKWPAGLAASHAGHVLMQGLQQTIENKPVVNSEVLAFHFDTVCAVPAPDIYTRHFERIKVLQEKLAFSHATMACDGRLFIGLSTSSLYETSISLDVTYGVPVIRGESCKGLVLRAATRVWEPRVVKAMFGGSGEGEGQGLVRFHDAWWVPSSGPVQYGKILQWAYPDALRRVGSQNPPDGKAHPLVREVVTPHHPKFQEPGHAATPFEEPTPVPLLAAHGSFRFAMQGPDLWRRHALELLRIALREEGIGARTPECGLFRSV